MWGVFAIFPARDAFTTPLGAGQRPAGWAARRPVGLPACRPERRPGEDGDAARGRASGIVVLVPRETRFLLIRHAQSTWNAEGRWQGQANPPLSEEGRRQAARLSRELADERVDCVIASDLGRAAETAAILAGVWGLTPELDSRLRELDLGSWTGLTRDQISRADSEALARFESGEPDARPGGGESRRELRRRVRAAAAQISREHAGRQIALVAHLGTVSGLRPGTVLLHAGWCHARASELARPSADEP